MVDQPKPGDQKGAPTPAPVPGGQTPATPAPAKPEAQPTPGGQQQPGAPAQPAPGQPQSAKPEAQSVPISALLDERGKRQALEAELNLLRQQQPQPGVTPYQPMAPIAPQQDIKAQVDRLWDTDPRQAVETQIMLSIDWYDRVNNSIDMQADMLAAKYPDFNNHRTAATRYVRSMPANQRGMPGVLESAYFYVRGQNVDSIIKAQEEELLRKYQAGEFVSQPAGAGQAPMPQPGGVQLTEEQRNVAAVMGMTDEEYAANIKSQPAGR